MTDDLGTLTYEKLTIQKEQFYLINNDFIWFRYSKQSKKYAKCAPQKALELLRKNYSLYETLYQNQTRKMVLDIDNHDKSKAPLSFNDLEIFINDMIKYIQKVFNIKTIPYTIHLSYEEDQLQSINPYTQQFYSAHIILNNIATKTSQEQKQLIMDFLTDYEDIHQTQHYFKQSGYIDYAIYSKSNILRQINQSKTELQDGKWIKRPQTLKRVYKCCLTNELRQSTKPTLNDLFTYITDDTNILTIDTIEKSKNSYEPLQNIQYKTEHNFKVFKKQMKAYTVDNYTQNYKWKYAVINLLYALYSNGITTYEDILQHELTQQFLQNSRVGVYDTDEMEYKNKTIIQNYLQNNTFLNIKYLYKDYIKPLSTDEIAFIKKYATELLMMERIVLTHTRINKKDFYKINAEFIYNINYKILCYDYHLKTDKEKKQKKLIAQKEYCFNFDMLKEDHKQHEDFLKRNTRQIESLSEIQINHNHSYYIKSPVDTGKTYHFLRNIVKDILTNDEDAVILVIADVITLTEKEQSDFKEILLPLGYDENTVYHYQDKTDIDHDWNSVKVIITTYDSYEKVKLKSINKQPYLIFDEFKNILKRTIFIQDKSLTNQDKSNKLNQLIKDINACKAFSLLDADYDNEIHSFLHSHIHKPFNVYSLANHKKPHKIVIMNEENALKDMKTHILNGKKIAIATTSQKYGKYIKEQLQVFKQTNPILIDKNGATTTEILENKELKTQLIQNTELWKKYNPFINTPTMTCGITFNDKKHFYKTYVYINKHSTDTTQTAQLTHRIRNTQTNEIVVIIRNIHNTLNKKEFDINDDLKNHTYLRNIGAEAYDLFKNSHTNLETMKLLNILKQTHQNDTRLQKTIKDFIKRNNTAYTQLIKYELVKEYNQYHNFLYEYCKTNYDWGVTDFNTKLFYELEEDAKIEDDDLHKSLPALEINDFMTAEYLDDEAFKTASITYKHKTDDTQAYRDFVKTITCKKYGISKWFYEKHKTELDEKVMSVYNIIEDKFNKLKKLKYMNSTEHIKYIVEHMKIENNYIKELMKHTSTKTKHKYTKIFNLYCCCEILNIMGLKYKDLKTVLSGEFKYEKTAENMNKLYVFMSNNEHIITYLNKVNKSRSKNTDDYARLKTFLTGVFSYMGLKCIMGREKVRCVKDKCILIQPPINPQNKIIEFRLQLLDNNEEDDKTYYVEDGKCITPKITKNRSQVNYDLIHTASSLLTQPKLDMLKNMIEIEKPTILNRTVIPVLSNAIIDDDECDTDDENGY